MKKDFSHLSEEDQAELVDYDGNIIQFIRNPSANVQRIALQQNLASFLHIDNPTALSIDTIKMAIQMSVHAMTADEVEQVYVRLEELGVIKK